MTQDRFAKDINVTHKSSEQDRAAFEEWAKTQGFNFFTSRNDKYDDSFLEVRRQGWQACRAHYAPKLTEEEARKIVADATYERRSAIAALIEAGMQFAEAVNQEGGE